MSATIAGLRVLAQLCRCPAKSLSLALRMLSMLSPPNVSSPRMLPSDRTCRNTGNSCMD